jgi:hypothetical protein
MRTLILYTSLSQKDNTEAALSTAFGETYSLTLPVTSLDSWDVTGYVGYMAGASNADLQTILEAIDLGAGLLCVDLSDTSVIEGEDDEQTTRPKTLDECLASNLLRRYDYFAHIEAMEITELRAHAQSKGISNYWNKSRETLLNDLMNLV